MINKSLQSILSLILLLSVQIKSQNTLVSPCPEVFEYDHTLQYPGRWYGVIKLSSNYTLYGLWLTIELDRQVNVLKTCVGSVTRETLYKYQIQNSDYIINPGEVAYVQIYVEYNVMEYIPQLTYISFNSREICGTSDGVHSFPSITGHKKYGIDTRGCPYRPGLLLKSSSDLEITEKSTEEQQTTPVTNKNEDDDDKLFGGVFVLPREITNYHNNSDRSRCGRVYARSPLVVGEATEDAQWPWQVSITRDISGVLASLALADFNTRFACSGTIVSTWHVITAAHCVTVQGRVAEKDKFILMIYTNLTWKLTNEWYSRFIKINTQDIKVHPGYDHQTFRNDLGILKSRYRMTFSTMIQPACFWPRTATTRDLTKIGTIAGWGFDAAGELRKGLSTIEMSEVDTDSCVRAHDPSIAAYLSDKVYCAAYVNGTSKCHNDSGGGMMIKIKNRWYLRGVLSFYYSPELQNKCQSYALFTDVAKHLPWIKQHVYDYV